MEDADRTSLAPAKGRCNKQWLNFQRLFPQEEHTKKRLKSQIPQVPLAALLMQSTDSPGQRLSLRPASSADGRALAELGWLLLLREGWRGEAPQHPSRAFERWNEHFK